MYMKFTIDSKCTYTILIKIRVGMRYEKVKSELEKLW